MLWRCSFDVDDFDSLSFLFSFFFRVASWIAPPTPLGSISTFAPCLSLSCCILLSSFFFMNLFSLVVPSSSVILEAPLSPRLVVLHRRSAVCCWCLVFYPQNTYPVKSISNRRQAANVVLWMSKRAGQESVVERHWQKSMKFVWNVVEKKSSSSKKEKRKNYADKMLSLLRLLASTFISETLLRSCFRSYEAKKESKRKFIQLFFWIIGVYLSLFSTYPKQWALNIHELHKNTSAYTPARRSEKTNWKSCEAHSRVRVKCSCHLELALFGRQRQTRGGEKRTR